METRAEGMPGALASASVAVPKIVKQVMVCHPERSEGPLQLFSP